MDENIERKNRHDSIVMFRSDSNTQRGDEY